MSFKRDGIDKSLLKDLQKRRIGDLLIDHIPEDEARLLSNGKYTCTICSFKPVFDTVEMLSIHRRGKKHKHYFARHLAKLKAYQDSEHAKNEDLKGIKIIRKKHLGGGSTLRKQKAYSSCSRKQSLDVGKSAVSKNTSSLQECPPSTSEVVQKLVKSYVSNSSKKRNFIEVARKSQTTYPKTNPTTQSFKPRESKPQTVDIDTTPKVALDDDEKARREYYSKLRQSGWKKDWNTGEWIRDEDAEFDSDEEPPDDSKFV